LLAFLTGAVDWQDLKRRLRRRRAASAKT